MRKSLHILAILGILIPSAALMLSSCKKEVKEEIHFDEYDDSTGLEITDSITVIFDGKQWKTLTYTSYIEQGEVVNNKWAVIKAHKPNSAYPAFLLKVFLEEGNHTTYMTINDPGMGFTIPGRLTGDAKGGALYYYENKTLSSPDGTRTSDWWPMEVTTSVLQYRENRLTARIVATMFDYESWVNREVMNVDSCEQKSLSITFGQLVL